MFHYESYRIEGFYSGLMFLKVAFLIAVMKYMKKKGSFCLRLGHAVCHGREGMEWATPQWWEDKAPCSHFCVPGYGSGLTMVSASLDPSWNEPGKGTSPKELTPLDWSVSKPVRIFLIDN